MLVNDRGELVWRALVGGMRRDTTRLERRAQGMRCGVAWRCGSARPLGVDKVANTTLAKMGGREKKPTRDSIQN